MICTSFTTVEGVVDVTISEDAVFFDMTPDVGEPSTLTIPRFKFEWVLEAMRRCDAEVEAI